MRPYLAVLKDSFREAFASRVLWILLILTTLLLAALAPVGLRERPTGRMRRDSVRNWSEFLAQVDKQSQQEGPSPGRQIASRWNPELKARLEAQREQPEAQLPGDLTTAVVEDLNRILEDRTLYDETAWKGIPLPDSAKELLKEDVSRLTPEETARLNRSLLVAAYPNEVAPGQAAELFLTYLGWHAGEPFPLTRKQAEPILKAALAQIMDFFVGILGILAAILVTAPIIPHMFEPGAIDLLLSKPVSRPLLFLTRFLGGCAFILLNATYFITGLWLIAGWRFGLWTPRLLLCIPIFLFLFAIYYSISALAGVLWRNAIVSVVLTILFWGLCFAVGSTKNLVELFWIKPARLVRIVPATDELFSVAEQGQIQLWNKATGAWEQIMPPERQRPMGPFESPHMVGMVYDAAQGRLLGIQTPPTPRGPLSFFGAAPTLLIGSRSEGWIRKKGAAPPGGTAAMLIRDKGEVLTLSGGGVSRLTPEPAPAEAPPAELKETFKRIGPDPALRLQAPLSAAFDPQSSRAALWSRGIVTLLKPSEGGQYEREGERTIEEVDPDRMGVIGRCGESVLVAIDDGRVFVLDASNLSTQQEFRPEGDQQPRFVHVSSNGRWFAVLFHNGKLWLYDSANHRPVAAPLVGQGDISAAAFDEQSRLLVVDRGTRVTRYQLDPFQAVDRQTGTATLLENVYRYGIVPIYTLFPKPGELGNWVTYLLIDQQSFSNNPGAQDLGQRRESLNIWEPVWSSLAFLVVVLALTCVYVGRADF